MKRTFALLAALALALTPAIAETGLAPVLTPTPTAAPTATIAPTASPTPEPAGTEYACDEFRVRLPEGLEPMDAEGLAGYDAAAQSDYPDAAEMRLVAANADLTAAISFAIADSSQTAAEAAREAATKILASDAGVVETRFGANECACFACSVEEFTFHMYYFSLGDRMLVVTASGLEDGEITAALESLEF